MAVIAITLLVLAVVLLYKRLTRKNPIPPGLKQLPGPKGLPLIGNVHEVPEKLGWIKFADWGQKYGPIYQVNLAGTNHVWISSDQISRDLLSKKAAIYSDRPHIPALIDDNRSSGQYLPLMSRNEHWTRQRKFANHIMRNTEAANFHQYPELEAIRMCKELMEDPTNYHRHLESFVSRVTCRLAWGHSEGSDELKQRARELLISVSPTGSFANKLPFVMSLPDWMSPPLAWEKKRKRTEAKWFQTMQDQVKSDVASGDAKPSWMKLFLDAPKMCNFNGDMEGAFAVGMHGIAGALTIAAPMQGFCLAMCHHPEYLPMLQEELDRVCPNRLPTYADRANLPFLRAVIREVMRWRPPVPTGIPHYLTEDDEYNGYFIPKGSVIHPLEWSISRDPEMFPDPETFNPLRWLEPEYPTYKEPLSQYPTILNMTQFGYGRRTCQGQTVTDADLIVGIGTLASVFNVSKPSKQDKQRRLMMNEKATISQEELITGMSEHSSDDEDDDIPRTPIGRFPDPSPDELREEYMKELVQRQEAERRKELEEDPTLNFTTLLIAKPLPFKFNMTVRDEKRAQMVHDLFEEKNAEGQYVPSREYWGPNQGEGKEYGWVKV